MNPPSGEAKYLRAADQPPPSPSWEFSGCGLSPGHHPVVPGIDYPLRGLEGVQGGVGLVKPNKPVADLVSGKNFWWIIFSTKGHTQFFEEVNWSLWYGFLAAAVKQRLERECKLEIGVAYVSICLRCLISIYAFT